MELLRASGLIQSALVQGLGLLRIIQSPGLVPSTLLQCLGFRAYGSYSVVGTCSVRIGVELKVKGLGFNVPGLRFRI